MLNSTQITAKVLQHSITEAGVQIASLELEYPRFIHSEFMTHRVFSRNAASSRAIPVAKLINQLETNLAHPIHWGANKPGMQADAELDDPMAVQADWKRGAEFAQYLARRMSDAGAHKQLVNRVMEPYTHIKTVVTTTELENFMELRDHKDAQPEIQALAKAMKEALKASEPMLLKEGEAHVPYIDRTRDEAGMVYSVNGKTVSRESAVKISASACAQVSYRLLDLGEEKALDIYEKLVSSRPIHASPFEHQATPMPTKIAKTKDWPKGITHMDREGNFWSGNFKGWIQQRQSLAQF